ncbi:choline BCCT transporter BetT [Nesterenkonia pannonica]|uniref:choline BCCT transporter BetT n=1 Tax=Nesterenkonia pannonica TaxID=1548602 RepID=UPI002164D359|nr:choline BCCT transporter BetT [Nesterenkonia pannonica]
MLFAAGIGVDLMFFSVVGPATNYLAGPGGAEPETVQAAEEAALWTMFHYGIPGWAMYALTGMAFGLFAYRYHLPLAIRSALYPIIGKRAQGVAGDTVEIAAVLGTIFGIATSLGIGVVFLSFGLGMMFGIETTFAVQASLIVLAAIVVTFSTYSGVEKGIRRLAELNVLAAIALMLYVLIVSETMDLLNMLVQNIGDFFAMFPGMLTQTFAFDTSEEWLSWEWLEWWTIFFWTWWMAWALFVGLFLARISRGRTLRQFIIGVLLVPFAFNALWISIFGNATVSRIVSGDAAFAEAALDAEGSGYFELISQYPGATFAIGVSVVVGLLFYVTSADSGSLVLANFTSKISAGTGDGPRWLRVVWSAVIGALTLVMLTLDGIYTLQMAAVILGLPLSLVLYVLMLSVWRTLRMETYAQDSREAQLPSALSERIAVATDPGQGRWKRRLRRHMHYPTPTEVEEYMTNTAMLSHRRGGRGDDRRGARVTCERGTATESGMQQIDLKVDFGDEAVFKYQAYPVEYAVPSFALNFRNAGDTYHRVEVFSATGSSGHDIFGYTKEQLITDVLDSYERHLTVLTMSDEAPGPSVTLDTGTIPTDWDSSRVNQSE